MTVVSVMEYSPVIDGDDTAAELLNQFFGVRHDKYGRVKLVNPFEQSHNFKTADIV